MSHLTIDLPESVIAGTREVAVRNNVTLEEQISRIVAEAHDRERWWQERVRRGKLVTRERFRAILSMAPDVEPEPWDRIE